MVNSHEPDAQALLTVPAGFTEAVVYAKRGMPGDDVATKLGDLGLLIDDIAGLSWEAKGLRVIGRAQFDLDAGAAAAATWELVRSRDETDVEANHFLAASDLAALPGSQAVAASSAPHTIIFTGHRIDAPGRATARFPASAERSVANEIGRVLDAIVVEHGSNLIAIAGAASGGDILFHEACAGRGIASEVYLALPAEQYATESVHEAGPDWTARFNDLLERHRPRVLQESEELPAWLAERAPDYSVWQRNNLWTLRRGLVFGGGRMTLLALWDGKGGDGPGGTADMVSQARARGARVVLLGAQLFGSHDPGP